MDIKDKKEVKEEPIAPRLTLVHGGSRVAMPHRAPKIELRVNPTWQLFEAMEANDPERVFASLARGADANLRDPDGRTPLFGAAWVTKDPAIAELLLGRGADVRARDKNGMTPLHVAAGVGDETRLRLFLDHGAKIDAQDGSGWAPLHCAADLGRLEEATFLVGRGADVSICDHEGRTPLDHVRDNYRQHPLRGDRWGPLERLLGGFLSVKVIEARPDSFVIRVEGLHQRYPDALREAAERGTLTVPASLFFHEVPAPGEYVRCCRGISPVLDKAWSHAQKRDIDIERER